MKQAILVRGDLKLPKGKLAVQCAHASVQAVLDSSKDKVNEWVNEGMPKIVLKVNDLQELKKYIQISKSEKLKPALIKDAGKTVLTPGTITCFAIGPENDEKINKIIKNLKLI